MTSQSEDTLFKQFLGAAHEAVEKLTGRQLLTAQWELRLPCFSDPIKIPKPPLQTVDAFEYRDDAGTWNAVTVADYEIDRGRVVPVIARSRRDVVWPTTGQYRLPVRVQYTAGWTDVDAVPAAIKQSILWLGAQPDEYREAVLELIRGGKVSEVPLALKQFLRLWSVPTIY